MIEKKVGKLQNEKREMVANSSEKEVRRDGDKLGRKK